MIGQALRAAGRFFDRAARVCTYAAAGAQRLAEVRREIEEEWRGFNGDAESMTAGLFRAEQDFVDRHLHAGSRILVIGSGTGRDVLALGKRGFRVTGVEPVARSIEMCRAALVSAQIEADLVPGFVEDVVLDDAAFDAAMFSFFTYSLIPTSARRRIALSRVAQAVKPDGVIFLSFMTTGAPSPG